MSPTRAEILYEAIAAVAIAALIYGAARVAGFLGVGVLGLAMTFVAFQADLNKAETSTVYAMRATPSERTGHAEKAARAREIAQLAHPILMGKLLGLSLAAIGLGTLLFF